MLRLPMPRRLLFAGVFAVSTATLALEILLTRLTSVVAWYHMAFFVIALGMLGMTAGAVWVFLRGARFSPASAPRAMARASAAFAVLTPAAVGAALLLPLRPIVDGATFAVTLAYGALLALPFAASGIALTLALTRCALAPGLVYGVDLLGAAVGCAAVIPLLDALDAPSAVLAVGAAGAVAAAAFQRAAGGRARPHLTLALALTTLAVTNASADPAPLRPRWVKGAREDRDDIAVEAWNTYSRVTASPLRAAPPALWGPSRLLSERWRAPIEQRAIEIDGAAGTALARLDPHGADPDPGDLPAHGYLEWDVTSFAHRLRPQGPAAVIGVGGGRDVLEAARAGHSPVVGIELNDLIVDLHETTLRQESGLTALPGVTLVADEARSFLARDSRRYSVLTMSLIDTWAATGAGAFTLSENGLYTIQAWQIFLRRLTPDGIFTVSRWYKPDSPGETGRMLALAMETLWTLGAREPRRHLVLLQSFNVATLLVFREPMTEADIDRVQTEAVRLGFTMVLTPRKRPVNPVLRQIVQQPSRAALHAWARTQPLDYRAPTDGRPFFFNMLRPGAWLRDAARTDTLDHAFLGNVRATQTLVLATAAALVLTLLAVFGPLLARRRTLRVVAGADLVAATAYFAAIGLGFMLVEMALLSRLSVLIGHPTLALAVLLGGMILATGAGSLASARVPVARRAVAVAYPLVPAALIALAAALAPWAAATFGAAGTATRVAVGATLVAVPGLGLGLGFPLGLRLLARVPGGDLLGPWMWGINGGFGVVASGLGLGLSMAFGTRTTMLAGLACYALLPAATARLHARGRPP